MFNFFRKRKTDVQSTALNDALSSLGPKYTEDLHQLEQQETTLFFVWCDMQKMLKRHQLLNGHVEEGPYTCYTGGTNFHLYKRNAGKGSPIMVGSDRWGKSDDNLQYSERRLRDQPARVRGELYLIKNPSSLFIELDKLRLNGYLYNRVRLGVYFPWSTVHARSLSKRLDRNRTIPAWMYVGRRDYWDPLLDAGHQYEPCRVKVPEEDNYKLVRYFYFDKDDYNRVK